MTMTATEKIRQAIRADALALGFDVVGFTAAIADARQGEGLAGFIAGKFHGQMHWLDETRDRRSDPRAMWRDARTAIVLGMNYGPDHDPMQNLAQKTAGNISVYARGRDYHGVIKGKLKNLAGRIAAKHGAQVKVFVDTAPLMEKPLAARAGLGWQGKHTNLVSRDFGSWLFIGVILTDADWGEDAFEADHCGSCTACMDVCPTNAFPAPYRLDARRCISYLTIEHKGAIPHEFRAAMGNRIFGCDDCLAVCPWNRFASEAREAKLKAMPQTDMPPLCELLALDEAGWRKRFAGSPVRRAGYESFIRNVLIAAGNAGDKNLADGICARLESNSAVIRGAAVWALGRILPQDSFTALRDEYVAGEKDDAVINEWNQGE